MTDTVRHSGPAARVAAIQEALRAAGLAGWLFYDFRKSDPLAYRILQLHLHNITSRRWCYYVPASGEPTKIVHAIEREKLDALPGRKIVYLPWQQLHEALREALTGATGARPDDGQTAPRVAMQYSPENAIPYLARVDAGMIELVRSFGVEPVTSADLVQVFEAVWTPDQKRSHDRAADNIHRIILDGFAEVARRIRNDEPTTEYDIQQFIVRRYAEEGMTCDGDHPIVSVNANSANPHYGPTAETYAPVRRGDFILFDVWAKLDEPGAVYADQTWTGYIGEAVPEEHERVFQIVRAGRDAAIEFVTESVRAGRELRGAEVDDVARGVITGAGYGAQFIHRTGHSIGEEVHGNGANIDNLETRDSRRLIPHTCFSIEPGVYLEGRFGVRSEVDMYIGDGTAEVTGQPIQTTVVPILKD
ncbi:MAG TPA: M24 family metallopeptidase [Pyrinomonadaceae bacterium]|jgi:Xaa-Pro aminopeptidase